ncbi:hypothetical protein COOONC_13587 [Cooperia oncophora]
MTISETDREKIDELRNIVKYHITPYYDTDYNLLRWLKGHDYNLEIITPKLINHLMLRKMWDLDTLADKPRDHIIHKHWKSGLTGEAVKTPNCVVNIEQTGGNDYWGTVKHISDQCDTPVRYSSFSKSILNGRSEKFTYTCQPIELVLICSTL